MNDRMVKKIEKRKEHNNLGKSLDQENNRGRIIISIFASITYKISMFL